MAGNKGHVTVTELNGKPILAKDMRVGTYARVTTSGSLSHGILVKRLETCIAGIDTNDSWPLEASFMVIPLKPGQKITIEIEE